MYIVEHDRIISSINIQHLFNNLDMVKIIHRFIRAVFLNSFFCSTNIKVLVKIPELQLHCKHFKFTKLIVSCSQMFDYNPANVGIQHVQQINVSYCFDIDKLKHSHTNKMTVITMLRNQIIIIVMG